MSPATVRPLRPSRAQPRGRAGFTLIEVLIAMGVFLVGVTALMGLFHFGGSMETSARAHASLAPAVEPLVASIKDSVWLLDAAGVPSERRELREQPVPGAPGYRYDLVVEPAGDDPDLHRARLLFYRSSPERPAARVNFLLPRRVPLQRRLAGGD